MERKIQKNQYRRTSTQISKYELRPVANSGSVVRQINDWNYVDVLLAIGREKKFKGFLDVSTYLIVI